MENGSFAGTERTNAGDVLVVFDASADIKWATLGYEPIMTTANGGVVGRNWSGTYEFDGQGNAIGQLAGGDATYSWNQDSYALTETIAQIARPHVQWAASYATVAGGNPSATGNLRGTFVGMGARVEGFRLPRCR